MVAELAVSDRIFVPLGETGDLPDVETWRDQRGRRLSDRVWLARQSVRDAIDRTLIEGIAAGRDPLLIADDLERWLNPALQPRRDAEGRLVDGQARKVVTLTPRPKSGSGPGLDGAGSYSARRLARTEITRAFGIASLRANRLNPFVRASKWNTSGRHKGSDVCDQNAARHSRGMGRGEYRDDEFPSYPGHSHCLCYITPVVDADPDAVVRDLRRAYRLDEPVGSPQEAERRRAVGQSLIAGLESMFRTWRALSGITS